MKIEYIKCHGSGNEFIMIDSTKVDLRACDLAELARRSCNRTDAIGADGLLLLAKRGEMYGMRMFNPDGSEAEMCGNGIRCVARLATQIDKTIGKNFDMWSGKKVYGITRQEDIFNAIPTFGVEMQPQVVGELSRTIPNLDEKLLWSGIDVGNPHIIARVDKIDYDQLKELGERVLSLKEEFPQGVNISLVEVLAKNCIFVATYERGAGITPSCGTAMTSSATAMALNGYCDFGATIEVRNRGGKVQCVCRNEGKLTTRLIGNATYMSQGVISFSAESFSYMEECRFDEEISLYDSFLSSIKR